MSKYAPEGLNNMAYTVLEDLAAKGEKSYLLIMQLAIKTGLNTKEVINQILRLTLNNG